MYIVEYRTLDEITSNYVIVGHFNKNEIYKECLLIDGEEPVAVVLNTNVCLESPHTKTLKNSIRCYIINSRDGLKDIAVSEIIDRYR